MTFTIYLTTECNFKCKYCYEQFEEKMYLTKEDAKKIIDFIMDYTSENITIVFMGGEPLLFKETIYYIINYINTNYTERKVKYNMTTNASLIDDNVIEVIKKEDFELRVSIDGDRYSHLLNRNSKNGKEYYDTIINNIEKIRFNNIPFAVRMTVTHNTLSNIYQNVKYFHEKGFDAIFIGIDFTATYTEEEMLILHQQLKLVAKYYIEEFDNGRKFAIGQIDGKFLNLIYDFNNSFNMCSAGQDTFKILPNLEVYPCEYLVGNRSFLIGEVGKYIDCEKSKKIAYKLFQKGTTNCSSCKIRDFCHYMKCGYANFVKTGKINIPSKNNCEIEKMYYVLVRDILLHLAEKKYDTLKIYKKYVDENHIKVSEIGKKVFQLIEM